jgi:hypothetical protein
MAMPSWKARRRRDLIDAWFAAESMLLNSCIADSVGLDDLSVEK